MSARSCSFGLRTFAGVLARGRVRQSLAHPLLVNPMTPSPTSRPFHCTIPKLANTKLAAGLRDSAIPFRTVQLVSSVDNSLGPPVPLSSILSSYSTKTHTLILVSQDPPIVKLIEKKDAQMKELSFQDKAKKRRARAMETSEVQVSWESAKADLEHKLAISKAVIERGDRLELVFAHKKASAEHLLLKGPRLEAAKKEALELFTRELKDISTKWKEDIVSSKMVAMFFEPNAHVRKEAIRKVDEADAEKALQKEKKKEERRKKEEERLARAAAKGGQ